jgi:hypothetical protein
MTIGLLDPLGLPVADRQMFFIQVEADKRAQEARQQREADFIAGVREIAPRILGEHLDAEMDSEHSANTEKVYGAHVARFARHCRDCGVTALPAPPEAVHSFVVETAGIDRPPPLSYVKQAIAAIGDWHRRAQLPNPCDDVLVRATMRWIGAGYRAGEKPKRRKAKRNGSGTEH